MQLQLDLFKPIEKDEFLTSQANNLLFMLNVDLKKKDHYEPKYYQQVNDLIVLIAKNKENDTLFNVINTDGETPKNFSVNWRNPNHVVQELKEYLN